MSFNSSIFIVGFLPLCLLVYCLLPPRIRKGFLFVASVFFYAWSEPKLIGYVLLVWFGVYMIGRLIERSKGKTKKILLFTTVIALLGILFRYKYWNFFAQNINIIFGNEIVHISNLELPTGISFIIFSLISYIVDIYKGDMRETPSFINFGLYCFHFAKISMGPISRYKTLEPRLLEKKIKIDIVDINAGFERFAIGFAKKAIVANSMAEVVDRYWNSDVSGLSVLAAWMVSICYTLQIYYDFSGYSDMAIGIARIFGFDFKENFAYPYTANSITDFWRRWHISLSSWFRDYIYIPLGGSRVSKSRNVINLLAVWLATGIWHGANWTFILWGIYYFVLLLIEKNLHLNKMENKKVILSIAYKVIVLLCVNFGWVLFRAPSLQAAGQFFTCMFGANANPLYDVKTIIIFKDNIILLFLAVVFSFPIFNWVKEYASKKGKVQRGVFYLIKTISVVCLFLIAISYCVNSTYNPFIYLDF